MLANPILLSLIADVCVNLCAGWFGAAFIIPATQERPKALNDRLIAVNLIYALAFFVVAYILKSV